MYYYMMFTVVQKWWLQHCY